MPRQSEADGFDNTRFDEDIRDRNTERGQHKRVRLHPTIVFHVKRIPLAVPFESR